MKSPTRPPEHKTGQTSLKRRLSVYLVIALLSGALLFGLATHLSNPVLPDDDAYITYRYADNLLEGHGLVYNPGQRVFGSSTPLYVIWLAGLHAAVRSVPTPELAVRTNYVFYVLTIVGVFFLLSSFVASRALAALLAGLLALHPSLLQASLGGMETFLFLGLLVWSLWALKRRKLVLSAWLAGLSVLARPEGMLMAAVVLVFLLLARRVRRGLIGLSVPSAAWGVFATAYYGTPIYHSVLAKSRPLYPLPAGAALSRLVGQITLWTIRGWMRLSKDFVIASLMLLALALLTSLLGYILTVRSAAGTQGGSLGSVAHPHSIGGSQGPRTRSNGSRVELAVADVLVVPTLFVLFVVFYASTNPLLMPWYFAPVDCLWFLALATGIVFAANLLKKRAATRLEFLPTLGLIALASGPTLLPLLGRLANHRPATDLRLESSPSLARTLAYRATADWLNRTVPPGDTVLAAEIGALGYYYDGHVTDACGLVSPEALPFLPVPDSERIRPDVGAISLELVEHLKSDAVVTMQLFACRSLYRSRWFNENYELVKQFRLPLRFWGPGGDTIDVFFKRGGRALRRLREAPAARDQWPRRHSLSDTPCLPVGTKASLACSLRWSTETNAMVAIHDGSSCGNQLAQRPSSVERRPTRPSGSPPSGANAIEDVAGSPHLRKPKSAFRTWNNSC